MNKNFYNHLAKLSLVVAVCLSGNSTMNAQEEASASKNVYVYNQEQAPMGFDNYQMATYYYNGNKTFNLRGYVASDTPGMVNFMKVNPSGTSFALLTKKKEVSKVELYDLWEAEYKLKELKKVTNASAIAYAPDARSLVVATATELLICDPRTLEVTVRINAPIVAKEVVVSPNNYCLAGTDGTRLIVCCIPVLQLPEAVAGNQKGDGVIEHAKDNVQGQHDQGQDRAEQRQTLPQTNMLPLGLFIGLFFLFVGFCHELFLL